MSKDDALIDYWAKELSPSPELRKWYSHDQTRWAEFSRRYRAELDGKKAQVEDLRQRARNDRITFVFAAKDETHSSALVLKEYLEGNT
jgi:uncharacterized protein YeaO (DUF488 family)